MRAETVPPTDADAPPDLPLEREQHSDLPVLSPSRPPGPQVIEVPTPNVNPETLLATAIERNVPIDVLERLIALREKLRAEQARAEFFAALARFQAECPIIGKNKETTGSTGSYSYKYAPLDEIVRQVQPILHKHGLSVTFDTEITDEPPALTSLCTVHHVGGHAEPSRFRVPIDKAARMNDTQKVGSANTYSKRYAYCNALGILTGDEDDDGKRTGGTGDDARPFTPPQRASAAKPAAKPAAANPSDQQRAPGAPDDAIHNGRIRRVYALIRTALAQAHLDPSDANVAKVETELDRAAVEAGRKKWQHVSYRDYDRLCGAIDVVVARLAAGLAGVPRAHERRVRR